MKHLKLTHCGLLVVMMFFSISLKAQITVEFYGSSTVYVGQTSIYYLMWRNGGTNISPPTPLNSYSWHVQNGTTSSVSSSSITVLWNAVATTTMVYDYSTPTNYYQAVLIVTVNPVIPNSPSTTYTTYRNCNNTIITRTASPPTGQTWYWQTTPDGTSTTLGSGSSITINSPTPLYLSARNSLGNWSSGNFVGNITILAAPPPAPAIAYDRDAISSSYANVFLSVSDVSGATRYQWFQTSTGGVPDASVISNVHTWYLPGTTTFYVASVVDGCLGTARKAVTAYFHPGPVISATDNGVTTLGSDVTLSLNYPYTQYQWKRDGVDLPGATSATYTTNYPGIYTVSVKKGNSTAVTSPAFTVANNYTSNRPNLNYIITETILKEGLTNVNNIGQYTIEQNQQSTQYFDGLGRPVQSVVTQGSPMKRDIVQATAYDIYGREPITYLPYISAENTGFFKTTFKRQDESGYNSSPQFQFYNNNSTTIAQDGAPYAETVFENSPLNRVQKQGAAGEAWQPGSVAAADRSVKKEYVSNTAGEVLLFSYTSATEEITYYRNGAVAYYPPNVLRIDVTLDEHDNEIREYKDNDQRTVLKRVQYKTSGAVKEYTETYYIYDDFDNLVTVLAPEAVRKIKQSIAAQ